VRELATKPEYRKVDKDVLASFIADHQELRPYLHDPSLPADAAEQAIQGSAARLAEWVHSLPKKLTTPAGAKGFYGKSPLEDYAEYMEGMTRATVTQQAVYKSFADNIVQVGDNYTGEVMSLADALDKAGYDPEKALSHISDMAGGNKSKSYEVLQNAVLPKEVAEQIASVSKKVAGEPTWWRGVGLWWDKITSIYKENLTLPWPAFAVRNFGSGQLMNTMSNHLNSVQDIADYAGEVALAKKIKADPTKYKDIVDELHIHDVYKYGYNPADIEHFSQLNMDVVPEPLLQHPRHILEKAREIVDSRPMDLGGGKFQAAVDKARVAHQTVLEAGRRASAEVEWFNRVPMYTYLRKKGFSAAEAASEVRKLHVDYSDLTQFEKDVMRRVIPFYSFSRKMMEQTAKQITERQGGMPGLTVAGSIKAIEALRNPGELVPDYVAETTAVPLGEDSEGNRNYITGFGLAFEDPLSFAGKGLRGAGLEALSRMHPLLKAPLEYSTGELFFQAGPDGGRDLKDADPLIGRTLANIMGRQDAVQLPQLLEVAAANSPASRYLSTTRQLMDPRKGLLTKATNLTTGVRVSTVSPKASDAILRENVNNLLRETGSRQFVRSYIPERIKEAMSPEELDKATQLQDTLNILARRAKARKALEATAAQ
jgi:hypothetical protein